MDKMDLLRYLSKADCFSFLSNGELKLYILLLVNASGVDTVENISLEQIQRANGNALSLLQLKDMMASLERYGLAVLEEVKGRPDGELLFSFRLKKPDN